MRNILLLYDTNEKDLARDLKDLLAEFNIEILMIPLSPDLGKTLQSKEEHYFDFVDGAIFLITPGSARMGKLFPSPSVADEMGQAKQKFKNTPEKVIYLVDKECSLQAIDQKSYIQFDRKNIRSVLEAIILLIKNLKQIGLFERKKIEHRETPGINISTYSESINDTLKSICFDLSDQPNGSITLSEFDNLLKNKYKMRNRDINFIKRDIQTKGLAAYYNTKTPFLFAGYQLTNVGFELVRYEIREKEKERQQVTQKLLSTLSKSMKKNNTSLSPLALLLSNTIKGNQ